MDENFIDEETGTRGILYRKGKRVVIYLDKKTLSLIEFIQFNSNTPNRAEVIRRILFFYFENKYNLGTEHPLVKFLKQD